MTAPDRHGELLEIHADADALALRLAERHAGRLQCRRGCAECCADGLSVLGVEAERIRRNNAELLAGGRPHPTGRCAFLDAQGACRIYADRPYVCRTQGLPLRWFGGAEDGGAVEYRDICPLNEAGPPVESLRPDDCFLLGPFEERLARLQASRGPGGKVALRSLFHLSPDPSAAWRPEAENEACQPEPPDRS